MMRSAIWMAAVVLAAMAVAGTASADEHAGDGAGTVVRKAETGVTELAKSVSEGSRILFEDAKRNGSKAADSAGKATREVGASAGKGATTLWQDVGDWFHSVFGGDEKSASTHQ